MIQRNENIGVYPGQRITFDDYKIVYLWEKNNQGQWIWSEVNNHTIYRE